MLYPGPQSYEVIHCLRLPTLLFMPWKIPHFLVYFFGFIFVGGHGISLTAPEGGVSHSLPKSALRTTTLGKSGRSRGP